MLSMLKRHDIKTLRDAGHTRDEVGALLGVSGRTVRRVAREPAVEDLDDDAERARRKIGRPSKVEPFRELVRKVLDEQPSVPSVELLRRAKEKSYRGGKSALFALVNELRPPKSEFVMRFEAVPGEFTQHDFGEVGVRYLDGSMERLIFCATRWKYSRWMQVRLVGDQTAETIARSACAHFAAVGGVPSLAVFDGPKTVALEWKKDAGAESSSP
jgi:hypothetical protein